MYDLISINIHALTLSKRLGLLKSWFVQLSGCLFSVFQLKLTFMSFLYVNFINWND